ncbi:MAG: bacteriohemerythrin [Bacteriovorax sp.]
MHHEWKWDDVYLTDHATVDYQHKILFNVINDLIRARNASDDPNGLLVEVALDELLKYATYHFRDEEEVMIKHNYDDLIQHQAQHKNFVDVMLKFKSRFDNNENITDELLNFMQKWLLDHILTRDKKAMNACC